MEWGGLGKTLIVIGLGLVAVGALALLIGRSHAFGGLFGWVGRLPGDILIKRDSVVFYLPLATSLLISVVLTMLITVLSFFFKR